jgi:putative ABC transport system ATP-binding protein
MMFDDAALNPRLQGKDLTRGFGQGKTAMLALKEVSIELGAGQVVLLMGPSGSGKSTLLAVLGGLLRPNSGTVHVLGQDLWALNDQERERFRLRHFGFIFQGYNLFGALNAQQQLEMVVRWGEGAPAAEARRRSAEMLVLLGLGTKSHLRPAELSGGEKQRVAIGRALIKDPQFCFADEPTSALDWEHGEQVVELLRNAARDRGATVLIVAHDKRVIPYADRLYEMEDGHMCRGEDSDDSGPGPRLHTLTSNP